ncbi:MAG: AAA family ATPase, partial [Chloroflexi bacterium]|nr:AAA family ATPase [Chloroflexota bacterium]
HEAVDATPLDAIHAKGKAEPVRAYRVDRVSAVGDARVRTGDLVGRGTELRALLEAYTHSSETRTVTLVTVLAHAGVGKSRLLREVGARLPSEAQIIRGRCLPYGDGTAQWPIREALRPAAGVVDGDSTELIVEKLGALAAGDPSARAIGEGVAQLMSVAGVSVSQDDAFWATRRILERMAETAPLVAIFEDLHWADAAFLDLLEYVVDLTTDVPLVIIATARPDLLEARPSWASGRSNTQLIRLESLDLGDIEALCRAQEGGDALAIEFIARIADASEGNPLFVEEMVAMLRDDGVLRRSGDGWEMTSQQEVGVPPTIRALIASRLDRLPGDARQVAARGSVIGRVFETAALAQIAPDDVRASLTAQLLTLVRRELIRPARADIGAGDAFAFRHVLIRDAAYEALPKRDRADLHARLADWIEQTTGDELTQFQEVIAHHLEEAYRYRVSLGTDDDEAHSLRLRAAEHLGAIGERALAVGSITQAASVLRRAMELAGNEASPRLLLSAGDALIRAGDHPGGDALLRRADEVARASGERILGAVARAVRAMFEAFLGPVDVEHSTATIQEALEVVRNSADFAALSRVYGALAFTLGGVGRLVEAREAAEASVVNARAAGDEARARRGLAVMSGMLIDGPTPVSEAIEWCSKTLDDVGESRNARYPLLETLGWLYSYAGRPAEARRAQTEAKGVADELGQVVDVELIALGLAETAAADGELDEAERYATAAAERLEELKAIQIANAMAVLSRIRTARGDPVAGLELLDALPLNAEWDVFTKIDCLRARALALLGLGRLDEAAHVAQQTLEVIKPTELVVQQADALETSARIHLARNMIDDAMRNLEAALEGNTKKGRTPWIQRTRELLATIR